MKVSGVWEESGPGSYKLCHRCSKLRDKVMSVYVSGLHHEEGPAFGELFEWWRELLDQWPRTSEAKRLHYKPKF